jgi:hypothetical protein
MLFGFAHGFLLLSNETTFSVILFLTGAQDDILRGLHCGHFSIAASASPPDRVAVANRQAFF